jgi:hypothetical protein
MTNETISPFNEVTVERLELALRMCEIRMDKVLIDKIIDLVELIAEKGGETTLKDVVELQQAWKEPTT